LEPERGAALTGASISHVRKEENMPTVGQFASQSGCSTAALRTLNSQIVEVLLQAVNTEDEKNLVPCDDIPLLRLTGNSTIPLLQPAARDSLARVIAHKNHEMDLIHAYRTIAQQFILREWKNRGKCGIRAARTPGTSDHERGLAIDIDNHEFWKNTLINNGWHWAGDNDPGHFNFLGDDVNPDVLTESVKAFQVLWNRNNPDDRIKEDGIFGDQQTGPRLLLSPLEGFAIVT
jgi:LAS superfamily LD-carboxypeptidase LdcB